MPRFLLPILFAVGALSACASKENPPPAPTDDKVAVAPVGKATVVKGTAPSTDQAAADPIARGSTPTAAGSQPVAVGSQPAARPAAPGSLPTGHPPVAGATIKGTLKLDPALADHVKQNIKPSTVLFLIARRDAGEGAKGMLLAAKRIPLKGPEVFPLSFEISAGDVMMQGTKLAGSVRVEARIDADGDAISKTPGDVAGKAAAPVTVGAAQPVDFTLDAKL